MEVKREDILRAAKKLPKEALENLLADFILQDDKLFKKFLTCCRKNGMKGSREVQTLRLSGLIDGLEEASDFCFGGYYEGEMADHVYHLLSAVGRLAGVNQIPWDVRKKAVDWILSDYYIDYGSESGNGYLSCGVAVHLAVTPEEAEYVYRKLEKGGFDFSDPEMKENLEMEDWYKKLKKKLGK